MFAVLAILLLGIPNASGQDFIARVVVNYTGDFEYEGYYQPDGNYYEYEGEVHSFSCHGTLISPSVILTSAQCVKSYDTNDVSIHVYMGCEDSQDLDTCSMLPVKSTHIFPDYKLDYKILVPDGDFALIVVDGSFDFEPATMMSPDVSIPTGLPVIALTGSSSTELFVIDADQCKDQFSRVFSIWSEGKDPSKYPNAISTFDLCASAPNQALCAEFDRGAPLTLRCEDKMLLLGALSLGATCGYSNIPLVFAFLSDQKVHDFLVSVVSDQAQELIIFSGNIASFCEGDIELQIQKDLELVEFESWDCLGHYFAHDDGCDCECGTFDPDCHSGQQALYNCDRWSQMCNSDGECQDTPNDSPFPTVGPIPSPTDAPSPFPSVSPTKYPSRSPSSYPTNFPTTNPTSFPSRYPTSSPSQYPTQYPTSFPTMFTAN